MRHHNPTSTSCWSSNRNRKCYRPYSINYSWTKPTPERRYVQVMKFILEHPHCKRFDILVGVFGVANTPEAKYSCRGYMSLLFSNMLYADLIDYNRNYEYSVTDYGRSILRKAGITEIQVVTKVTI